MGPVNMVIENNAIISVQSLDVDYHTFSRSWKYPLGKISPFRAIKNLDLEIFEGEIIGLIGRNGSGKTTLLKSIFGELRPESGKIETDGRVILLSGVDPGFIPYLSGRQNVLLLAKAYGIDEEKIDFFVSEVEEFASIGDAFDRQFSTYSTGMRGKVGFGFLTGLDTDILLIDETLGVGDQEFREKARERLEDYISRSGTVIISTHSMGLAKNLCNRGLLMESGELLVDSSINEAIQKYNNISSSYSKK